MIHLLNNHQHTQHESLYSSNFKFAKNTFEKYFLIIRYIPKNKYKLVFTIDLLCYIYSLHYSTQFLVIGGYFYFLLVIMLK
jgi:hypothetical protein